MDLGDNSGGTDLESGRGPPRSTFSRRGVTSRLPAEELPSNQPPADLKRKEKMGKVVGLRHLSGMLR